MGREIRRVIPNWQHPKRNHAHRGEEYKPLYDNDSESAWAEWQAEFAAFIGAEHDRIIAEYGEESYPKGEPYRAFCAWHCEPPDPNYYRPKWDESAATWFQVYETVSEGTPVTPPFATKEELVDYLVANGDFWDQRRRRDGVTSMECGPWDRAAAERFVGIGWAPSLLVTHTAQGVSIQGPRDGIV